MSTNIAIILEKVLFHTVTNRIENGIFANCFMITEKTAVGGRRWKSVGVMKDKYLILEDVNVCVRVSEERGNDRQTCSRGTVRTWRKIICSLNKTGDLSRQTNGTRSTLENGCRRRCGIGW